MLKKSIASLIKSTVAVILQHEIKNSKTKIYIASFQMALELGYLKGGYVNFDFAALDLYCKITAICCMISNLQNSVYIFI